MGYFNSVPDENIWTDKILKWIVDIGLVILCAVLFIHFFASDEKMEGKSMETAIASGDYVLVNKLTYYFFTPARGDVVVFQNEDGETSIKRIVGVPGDKVQIKEGELYLNGKADTQRSKREKIVNAGLAEEEITIPRNEYFVMGDDSNRSEDSRFTSVGCIKESDIIGKVWMKAAPFTHIGLVQ